MQVGDLSVKIGADTSGLTKGLGEAQKSLGGFNQSVGDFLGNLKMAHLAIAGAVAGVAKFVNASMDAIDATSKLARQLNTTYESLSTLQRVAELAGISNLEGTLRIFNQRLSEAQQGSGPAADAIKRLGLNAQELANLPVDQRVELLGKKMMEMVPPAEQAAMAVQLFGRDGQRMLEVLRDTGSIEAARNEVQKLGLALSDVDARQVEMAGDALSIFGKTASAIGNQIAVTLAPYLAELGTWFNEVFVQSGILKNGLMALDIGIRFVVAAIRDVVNVLILATTAFAKATNMVLKFFNVTGKLRDVTDFAAEGFDNAWDSFSGGGRVVEAIKGVDAVKAKWQEAAQAAVDSTRAMQQGGVTGGMSEDQKKELQKRIEAIQNALRTESELQSRKYQDDVLALQKARDAGLEIEGGYHAALQALTENHIMKMNEIDANSPEAKRAETLANNLAKLQESFLTEEEMQLTKYAQDLELLNKALAAKLLTEEEWNKLFQEAEQYHQDKLSAIRKKGLSDREKFEQMSAREQAKTIFAHMANITAGVSSHNKTLFDLNKAAGIANAIISAYEGISLTLAKYPYPVSVAMAALQGAAAFAQVRAIASQSYSGGKSAGGATAPSLAGSTAAPPVSAVSGGVAGGAAFGGGQIVSINLQGEVFGREQVRGLIGQINEAISDGAVLRIA
jgi:P2-related tail formation protein